MKFFPAKPKAPKRKVFTYDYFSYQRTLAKNEPLKHFKTARNIKIEFADEGVFFQSQTLATVDFSIGYETKSVWEFKVANFFDKLLLFGRHSSYTVEYFDAIPSYILCALGQSALGPLYPLFFELSRNVDELSSRGINLPPILFQSSQVIGYIDGWGNLFRNKEIRDKKSIYPMFFNWKFGKEIFYISYDGFCFKVLNDNEMFFINRDTALVVESFDLLKSSNISVKFIERRWFFFKKIIE